MPASRCHPAASRDAEGTTGKFDLERDMIDRLGYTSDSREGVAAFMEKRTPVFIGR